MHQQIQSLSATAEAGSSKLSAAEVARYHLDGYLGPYTLCSPEEMAELKARIDHALHPDQGEERLPRMINALNPAMRRGFGRHHDYRFLFDIANSPAIKERVAGIMGEDLLLWRTMFFNKEPGGKLIPWHQDYDGWLIEPMLVTSAWLAIDEATSENGCVELVPGSHRKIYPLVPSLPDVMDGFPQMADPGSFVDSNAVAMALKPGQFFLFNERTLHRSRPNATGKRRLGMAMRYIPTLVRVLDPDDRPILISGEDKLNFNRLAPIPTSQPDECQR